MKKILLSLFSLFFLSSCYETKIDPDAILYEDELRFEGIFTINSIAVDANNNFFGVNNSWSTAIGSVEPYQIPIDSCLNGYSVDIKTAVSGTPNNFYLYVNEQQEADSQLSYTGGTGFKEKSLNIRTFQNDQIKLELMGTTMGGNLSATVTLNFGPCQ